MMDAFEFLPDKVYFCDICGQKARGRHYGAVACRACAAFFRRAKELEIVRPCKNGGNCTFYKNGFFGCKYCRLQKCLKVGMSSESFQFDRDKLSEVSSEKELQVVSPRKVQKRKIPVSISNFIGRPDYIIYCAPKVTTSKHLIDVQFLLDQAMNIIQRGPETPVYSPTKLGKLAIGLGNARELLKLPDPRNMIRFGKDETLAQWERDFLKMTRWLTYFDDYLKLSESLQLTMITHLWSAWRRLEMLAIKAMAIRKIYNDDELGRFRKDERICSFSNLQVDMSWCSTRSVEELKSFVEIDTELLMDDLTRAMIELDPTNEELSFMMCQLCFHYVGKRFQGHILNVTEKFVEVIANDLHHYYLKEQKRTNYASRLAAMMKLNNQIQERMMRNRSKIELAVLFDIFHIEFSHPEMFESM